MLHPCFQSHWTLYRRTVNVRYQPLLFSSATGSEARGCGRREANTGLAATRVSGLVVYRCRITGLDYSSDPAAINHQPRHSGCRQATRVEVAVKGCLCTSVLQVPAGFVGCIIKKDCPGQWRPAGAFSFSIHIFLGGWGWVKKKKVRPEVAIKSGCP